MPSQSCASPDSSRCSGPPAAGNGRETDVVACFVERREDDRVVAPIGDHRDRAGLGDAVQLRTVELCDPKIMRAEPEVVVRRIGAREHHALAIGRDLRVVASVREGALAPGFSPPSKTRTGLLPSAFATHTSVFTQNRKPLTRTKAILRPSSETETSNSGSRVSVSRSITEPSLRTRKSRCPRASWFAREIDPAVARNVDAARAGCPERRRDLPLALRCEIDPVRRRAVSRVPTARGWSRHGGGQAQPQHAGDSAPEAESLGVASRLREACTTPSSRNRAIRLPAHRRRDEGRILGQLLEYVGRLRGPIAGPSSPNGVFSPAPHPSTANHRQPPSNATPRIPLPA